jgi:hypothetical protein
LFKLSDLEIKKQANYKGKGQIYSKSTWSFGDEEEAQSKVTW